LARIPTICIVDDDASVRNAFGSLARSLGLDAYLFAYARELLDSPRLHDTSCIIADIQMPGMSGLELQRLLQMMSLNVPMIFITAYPDEQVRDQAFSAGAVGFFDKPFDGAAMVACIERAIGGNDGYRPG
jgi:FixJ family two-component response regulator